jgi:hypothetical protein
MNTFKSDRNLKSMPGLEVPTTVEEYGSCKEPSLDTVSESMMSKRNSTLDNYPTGKVGQRRAGSVKEVDGSTQDQDSGTMGRGTGRGDRARQEPVRQPGEDAAVPGGEGNVDGHADDAAPRMKKTRRGMIAAGEDSVRRVVKADRETSVTIVNGQGVVDNVIIADQGTSSSRTALDVQGEPFSSIEAEMRSSPNTGEVGNTVYPDTSLAAMGPVKMKKRHYNTVKATRWKRRDRYDRVVEDLKVFREYAEELTAEERIRSNAASYADWKQKKKKEEVEIRKRQLSSSIRYHQLPQAKVSHEAGEEVETIVNVRGWINRTRKHGQPVCRASCSCAMDMPEKGTQIGRAHV